MKQLKSIRIVLLVLSIVAYLAALAVDAIVFKRDGTPVEPMNGANVLLIGWLGILVSQYGWYANLLIPAGFICALVRAFTLGKLFAIASLALSAISLAIIFSQEFPANEGGVGPPMKVTSLGIGCWLWLLSQLLILVANFVERKVVNVSVPTATEVRASDGGAAGTSDS